MQTESYTCDGCGKDFTVEPVITYKAGTVAEEFDFSNQSVSLL